MSLSCRLVSTWGSLYVVTLSTYGYFLLRDDDGAVLPLDTDGGDVCSGDGFEGVL